MSIVRIVTKEVMYFSTILAYSCILTVKSISAPTHLLVTRVGACQDEPQVVMSVSELSITTETYDSSVSGTINISENISNGWKIEVTIEKCLDIRNTDTCDNFKSFFLVRNGCIDDGNDEQDIYGMLFYYIKPKLECPIQAGSYRLLNYPFFTEDNYVTVKESKISTSMFGYIYRLHGYSKNKHKILCVEACLQLIYIRHHDWVQNTDLQATTLGLMYSKRNGDDEDKSDNSRQD